MRRCAACGVRETEREGCMRVGRGPCSGGNGPEADPHVGVLDARRAVRRGGRTVCSVQRPSRAVTRSRISGSPMHDDDREVSVWCACASLHTLYIYHSGARCFSSFTLRTHNPGGELSARAASLSLRPQSARANQVNHVR